MRISIKAFALFFLLAFSFEIKAQQYQFQNFNVADGLAQSQVFSICETSDGYVWMATQGGGLSRFDGQDFETFTTSNNLHSNYIHSLFATEDLLIIGTNKGLNVFQNEAFIKIESPEENFSIAAIEQVATNQFALATNLGLYLFDGKTITKSAINVGAIGSLYALEFDSKQNLWIGGNTGLLRCHHGDCVEFTLDSGLNVENVRSLYEDQAGNIWIGTYGAGANAFINGNLLDVNEFMGIPPTERIHGIYSDDEGFIWFATQQMGLVQYNSKTAESTIISEKDGLANNHVRCIFRDSYRNYWIGTSGGGVSKYTGQLFNYYSKKSGLTGNYIYAVHQDSDGDYLIATNGRGVQHWNGDSIWIDSLPKALSNAKVKCIYESTDCELWYGTDGDGLWVQTADTFLHFDHTNGLKSDYVRCMVEDFDRNIWVGTAGGGLFKIQKVFEKEGDYFELKSIGLNAGVKADRINALAVDFDGRIWFGSLFEGLGVIEDDTLIYQFTPANGLSDNNVNSLVVGPNGDIWVGTVTAGINRIEWNNGVPIIDSWKSPKSLASNIVYQLQFDDRNRLWIGSEKGVEVVTFSTQFEAIERKLYNHEDGFIGVETTLNSAFRALDGSLWFGTINGLSVFENEPEQQEAILPKLRLTKLLVNAQRKSWLEPLALTYDSNLISIEFKAISQTRAKSIRYQFRLIGLDTNWSEASQNQSITYSNLGHGNYRFEVRASTDLTHWTEPETIEFSIDLPYWETTKFIAIVASSVVLLLLLIGLWVYISIRNRIQRQKESLIVEKELIKLEQKALRLQMNPHFIFNALNSIQALVSTNDAKTARLYLAKFSKLMRQILDNSRKTSILLENEIATLENYLAIEQFCHNNRFDFLVETEDSLLDEELEIPPMLIQPFVENAIVHGVSQMQGQGFISVKFSLVGDNLLCEIKDNGIGRQAATKMRSQRDQAHKSTALLITQERLDRLNPDGNLPGIEMIDLKDEAGNATGTLVRIRIAIKPN